MRRSLSVVVLLTALVLLVVGSVVLVGDLQTIQTATVAPDTQDDTAPSRPSRRSAEPLTPAGGIAVTETPIGSVAKAGRERAKDAFTSPLPPDVFRDPMRETSGVTRTHVGVGGKIGIGGSTASRMRAHGLVVDTRTGLPIGAARMTVVIPNKGEDPWGYLIRVGESREDGRFALRTRSLGEAQRRAAELVVNASGYRSWRGRLDRGELRVELAPVAAGDLSGTIAGRATDAQGRRLYGPLLISLRSDHVVFESQWALAGSDGRFRLEGVSPGRWWVRVADGADQDWTEVRVAAGTEASVELRGVQLREPPASGGFGPRREVVVRASPEVPDRTVVRAETGKGLFWRTTVLGGEARFELPRGGWTIVTLGPPGTDVRRFVTVADGAGPQVVGLSE